jgi:outer membrane lipoprotein carrier protein
MPRTSIRSVVVFLSALAALSMAASATAPPQHTDPTSLARAIQQRYDRIKDFSAAFTHSYQGGVLRKTVVERGTVKFKKPGMMRWLYTSPERKEFVSDGVRIYAYVPEDRQVTVSAVPPGDDAPTPALFLAGRGDLTRDFTATAADKEDVPSGYLAVKLTPRRSEPEFEWMIVTVDAATLQIRGLTTADAQGGRSSFAFERVRENTGAADTEFRFSIPRGVDVISNNEPRR